MYFIIALFKSLSEINLIKINNCIQGFFDRTMYTVKLCYFIEKLQKSPSTWGFATKTPCLQQLVALPSDPHWPPAAGDSASRPRLPPPLRISGYATNSNI